MSGQPVLVMHVSDPGRLQLYSIPTPGDLAAIAPS